MEFLFNWRMPAAALVLACGAASPASAQDDEPAISVSATAWVASDYRFRGVSFSDGDPVVQAEFIVEHETGFYAGIWASPIDDGGSGIGDVEIDLFGGWAGDLAEELSADINLIYYYYPDADGGPGSDYDSFEVTASLTQSIGNFAPTVGVSHAWEQAALGGASNLYFFLDTTYELPGTPVTLTSHFGLNDGSYAVEPGSKEVDWAIGAEVELSTNFALRAEYIGISAPSVRNYTNDTLLLTLRASI